MSTEKPSTNGAKVIELFRKCPKCATSVHITGKCRKCECDYTRCLEWDIDLDYQIMQETS